MKKSELRHLVREELRNIMSERSDGNRMRLLFKWPKQGFDERFPGCTAYAYMLDNGYEFLISKGAREIYSSKWPYTRQINKVMEEYRRLGLTMFLSKYENQNGYDARDRG